MPGVTIACGLRKERSIAVVDSQRQYLYTITAMDGLQRVVVDT